MLDNGHSVEVAALLLPTSVAALHQADVRCRGHRCQWTDRFRSARWSPDAVDGGIGRNGKAIIGAFQVMRCGTTEGDLGIVGVSSSDIAGFIQMPVPVPLTSAPVRALVAGVVVVEDEGRVVKTTSSP